MPPRRQGSALATGWLRALGVTAWIALASPASSHAAQPAEPDAPDAPALAAGESADHKFVPPRTLEQALGVASGRTPESLRDDAERARAKGERFRAYALLDLARRALESRGASGEKEARRLADRQREWTRELFPEEAACAAAWCGATPDLSLHFARRMNELGHGDDAAAELLALLGEPSVPAKTHEEAAKLLGELRRSKTRAASVRAGGVHASAYRVAAVLPLSGDYGIYGRSLLAGLRLALEDSLAPSSALPVRIESFDSHADPAVTVDAARKALDEGSGAVVGEVLSLATFVLAGICEGRGVTLLSPSATDERIGEIGPRVLQTGLSRGVQAWALAEDVSGRGGAKRIAIAETNGAPSEFAAYFRTAAESLGVETIVAATPSGRRDASDAIAALQRAGADALLLPDDAGAAELWISGLGKEPSSLRLLASEALDPAALSPEARKRVEGLTLVGLEYALPDSVFARVDAGARARFGVAADRFVRRGYLTGMAIARGIRQRAASPQQLADALTPKIFTRSASGEATRRFVHYSETETIVPLLVWRRGSLVRVR